MYFMIGLPTETDEDVAGIAELGRKVRELGRAKFNKNIKATCSASYFVPKPHTPFQWCGQEGIESIKQKQRVLKDLGRRYRIEVKVHHAETSVLEGIISRGDRNLCRVVERAWKMGARFDGWTEQFKFETWMEAFKLEGVDINPYLQEFPVREFDKPGAPLVQLPWDHIDTLVKREFNAREYIRGVKAKISPPCELPVTVINGRPTAIAPSHEDFERVASQPLLCYNCGLECDLSLSREHLKKAFDMHVEVRTYEERIAQVKDQVSEQPLVQLSMSKGPAKREPEVAPAQEPKAPLYRYRATFTKGDEVKYLSHLDLTRALPRAFRRAKLVLGYSHGFHPMPLIQYGPALGVGTAGDNELIDFDTPDAIEERDFLRRINGVLPEGLRFKSVARLPENAKVLIKEVNRAEYSFALDAPEMSPVIARARADRPDFSDLDEVEIHKRLIDEFFAKEDCFIERSRKGKRQRVDVRRYTLGLEIDLERNSLRIVTEISANGGVKPMEVIASVYGLIDEEMLVLSSRARRLRLYSESLAGSALNLLRDEAAVSVGGQTM
jgi:radical SAM-linked protein